MRRLAILGAGGHGRVIADAALLAGWDEVVFFDDALQSAETTDSNPIAGDRAELIRLSSEFAGAVVAIGDSRIRLVMVRELLAAGLDLPPVLRPSAYVARNVVVGPGTVVLAGAIVQPGSTLGPASIVNTGATVDHDCSLAGGVHVCPGANLAGGVKVGECTWIGLGACIIQLTTIGASVTIGAGAAVIGDLPDRVTAVGVPAKIISEE